MGETKKQILLRKAAALMGGQEELAARLQVRAELLDAWISGDATMPDGKLFALATTLAEVAAGKVR